MTSTTRRNLLRATVIGAALAPVLVAPEVFAAATTRRDLYQRSRFAVLRRKSFRMEGAGRHWRMRLTAVDNLANGKRRDPRAFGLTFRAGAAGPEQGSYVFRRPGFKPTTLFVVPSDPGRRTYQAVIFRKP
ncbi:DUF6916 family protein [Nocardioides halotolerans]|jgi:hypothetical protein|uniref:DUF6916 family protein n=1 Tax=Nocardioides halotolerans TaxID=433660 RepID=UPI00042181A5|nr:hypothetical protein [Nocardioides halotolerans]